MTQRQLLFFIVVDQILDSLERQIALRQRSE